MLETHYSAVDLQCTTCHASWEAPFAQTVNVQTHPDARLGILLGTMHKSRCPVCKVRKDVEVIFEYYDPDQNIIVQIRPEWEYHAGGGEEWYLARLEDLVLKHADKDVRVDVVFGFEEMIEKYLGGEAAVAQAKAEWEERKAVAAAAEAEPAAGETDDREEA